MLDVVIPLKRLDQAKSRLASVLSPGARRELVRAMALDILEQCALHPAVRSLWVIGGEGWAGALAEAHGAVVIPERELGASGLNSVCERALARLAPRPTLLLHGDLPRLGAEDLSAIAEGLQHHELLLCPDLKGIGTNALAFTPGHCPALHFGEHSFRQHSAAARRRGSRWRALYRPGLCADLDSPDDLAALRSAWCLGEPLGARIAGLLGANSTQQPNDTTQPSAVRTWPRLTAARYGGATG